jgi:hypothetical protein
VDEQYQTPGEILYVRLRGEKKSRRIMHGAWYGRLELPLVVQWLTVNKSKQVNDRKSLHLQSHLRRIVRELVDAHATSSQPLAGIASVIPLEGGSSATQRLPNVNTYNLFHYHLLSRSSQLQFVPPPQSQRGMELR